MELNTNTIQDLKASQIYNEYTNEIDKLYNKYSFLDIPKQKFDKIVINEIEKTKKLYNDEIPYANYLENIITYKMEKSILHRCNYENRLMETLNSYIKNNNVSINNYNDVKNIINKINIIIEKYDYTLKPEIIINLLSNNKDFSKMIETIFNNHYNQIINGRLETITDNSTLLSIIEMYCLVNNIEKIEKYNITDEEIDDNCLDDNFKIYLQDIKRIPLLSPKEEKEIGYRILEGDKEAKKILIESNLRLALSIAKKYQREGISFEDLIQEGNLGLMVAVEKYDVTKGYKFSTYAIWWIRQHITRWIKDKGRTIRIPVYFNERLIYYNKTYNYLYQRLNRKPTTKELSEEMNLTIQEILNLQKYGQETKSLNKLISDSESELEDFIKDDNTNVEKTVIKETMQKDIRDFLLNSNLTMREKEVLIQKFGIFGEEPATLEEIGRRNNVTRERIRQIKERALNKLAKPDNNIKKIISYIDDSNELQEILNQNNIKETAKKSGKINNKIVVNWLNNFFAKENISIEYKTKLVLKISELFHAIGLNSNEVKLMLLNNKYKGLEYKSIKQLEKEFAMSHNEIIKVKNDLLIKLGKSEKSNKLVNYIVNKINYSEEKEYENIQQLDEIIEIINKCDKDKEITQYKNMIINKKLTKRKLNE